MKDTATIDGVTITCEQAEKALEEMNRVDLFKPKPGTQFRYAGTNYIVMQRARGGGGFWALAVTSGREAGFAGDQPASDYEVISR